MTADHISLSPRRLVDAAVYFGRPTAEDLTSFVDRHRGGPLSYEEVGATRGRSPTGYDLDTYRTTLGHGASVFAKAKAALQRMSHLRLKSWVAPYGAHDAGEPTLVVGRTFAVTARIFNVWFANLVRIVYVIDEDTRDSMRFGFAYGTLHAHVEEGEEQFVVKLDKATGEVTYEITAFSRPRHPFAKLAYAVTRRMQKRFAKHSMAKMRRVCR